MLKEFQEFIAKGNVLDLAVGVIIGQAFSKIVDALVEQIITPLLTPLTDSVDFTNWKLAVGPFEFGVGIFINAVIQFLLVGFVLFLLVRGINRLRRMQDIMPSQTEDVTVSQLSQQNVEQNKEIIALLRSIDNKATVD